MNESLRKSASAHSASASANNDATARPAAKPAVAEAEAKPAANLTAAEIKKRRQAAAAAGAQASAAAAVRPAVAAGGMQLRHWVLALSFLGLVVLPTLIGAWYMWTRAVDQYVSTVGFSVRQEDSQPAVGVLGGLTELGLSSGGATDSNILYDFLQSEDLVARVDDAIDLRTRFSRPWPDDRVFGLDPSASLEELTDYWQRQVKVQFDDGTQLLTLKVAAFTPEDALTIAKATFDEGSRTINRLSDIAREDATRYASRDLANTQQRLTEARQRMTAFRMRTQIVDPAADLAAQMGILGQLQVQLAEALVALDTLRLSVKQDDVRVDQAENRIDAIRRRIAEERSKFGANGENDSGENYAELMAEYEKLAADLEFAEAAYRSAQANYDVALADAQRQSRYLAAHIEPRLAQISTAPKRPLTVAGLFCALLLLWSVMLLVYYSLRDRR